MEANKRMIEVEWNSKELRDAASKAQRGLLFILSASLEREGLSKSIVVRGSIEPDGSARLLLFLGLKTGDLCKFVSGGALCDLLNCLAFADMPVSICIA